jgi:hypothetical protein
MGGGLLLLDPKICIKINSLVRTILSMNLAFKVLNKFNVLCILKLRLKINLGKIYPKCLISFFVVA